jgi:hypothetical protein
MKMYEFGVAFNSLTFVPNFVKFGQLVGRKGHTDSMVVS